MTTDQSLWLIVGVALVLVALLGFAVGYAEGRDR